MASEDLDADVPIKHAKQDLRPEDEHGQAHDPAGRQEDDQGEVRSRSRLWRGRCAAGTGSLNRCFLMRAVPVFGPSSAWRCVVVREQLFYRYRYRRQREKVADRSSMPWVTTGAPLTVSCS